MPDEWSSALLAKRIQVSDRLGNLPAQLIMLRRKSKFRVGPILRGVKPDRKAANVVRFPFVPWPDMRMEKPVGISEDFEIDPAKVRIQPLTHPLDSLPEEIHIVEKRKSRGAFQVSKPFGSRTIGKQHAIPG